ncbi:MAG: hypothetical protein IKI67_08125 [Bacteroidales bacterium]|nr:hypothetical protein [Bacteroidales bacterium]
MMQLRLKKQFCGSFYGRMSRKFNMFEPIASKRLYMWQSRAYSKDSTPTLHNSWNSSCRNVGVLSLK